MSTDEVDVSIVIPAYNAEGTIGEQLAAIARQRVDFAWEVIVADNGSTDKTAAIARTWSVSLPLRLIDASGRRGASAARNAAVTRARGRFLVFCDADDVVADDWLQLMHDALSQDAFVGAGGRRRHLHASEKAPTFYVMSTYAFPFFPQLPITGGGQMGLHAELYRSVGGYDESIRVCEDNDLCWRLQLAGHVLTPHPEALINVRRRAGLRALVAQSYATGRGERLLRHRYARVIEAYQSQYPLPAESTIPPAEIFPAERPGALAMRIVRKLLTIRDSSDIARVVHLVSLRLGQRYGRIDRSAPQVEPPTPLPPPGPRPFSINEG
jgi:glycosyltransferase involved in cell wall biosynthesis